VQNRLFFSLTSVLFHVAVIIVPVFLAGHVALWARGLGISWPAIPNGVADVLTIVGIVTAVALIIQRLSARATRGLSRFEDYFLPVAIAVPFATGFLVMHPSLNPFSFQATLFVHVMSANLVLILTPLTKLSHMVLIPGTQLVSEVAWHWPADAGSKLAVTLGKEGEPV
jgi:nitrate reductase gamma subunit